MVSAQKFDKNQNVTILAWNIPILYMVFTQKIRNFVVLVFIRPVKKTYNAEFISQICMEHILRKCRKTIVGRGVRAPGDVAFHNVQNTQYETGPLFSVNNDWLVKNVKLRVQKCSFAYCTIRLIVYEIIGTQFVPIQHRPIYIQVSKISNKKDFSALVEEPLKLKHNHKYYIGVAVMASSGNGGFSL